MSQDRFKLGDGGVLSVAVAVAPVAAGGSSCPTVLAAVAWLPLSAPMELGVAVALPVPVDRPVGGLVLSFMAAKV